MFWKLLDNLFETKIWKVVVVFLCLFLFTSFVQLLIIANQSINVIVNAADLAQPKLSLYINSAYFRGILAILIFLFLALLQIVSVIRDKLIANQYRSLSNTMLKFADGDISTRYQEQSIQVVNKLGRTFNQMADSLQSLIQELRRSEKDRREVVANVAHDLAGPLTSISGYVDTLSMSINSVDSPKQKNYCEIIKKNLKTITLLVRELSELSRLDLDELTIQKDLFSMRVLANDIVSRFEVEAKARTIKLKLQPYSSEGMIYADLYMIERVISNLVENALNYTQPNNSVSVLCTEERDLVTLEVSDTGIGIPSEDITFVFERFYRVDKDRSRLSGGSGLGLAIVKKIVELHKGQIKIESTVAKGTKIQVVLPKETAPSIPQLT